MTEIDTDRKQLISHYNNNQNAKQSLDFYTVTIGRHGYAGYMWNSEDIRQTV